MARRSLSYPGKLAYYLAYAPADGRVPWSGVGDQSSVVLVVLGSAGALSPGSVG